MPNFVSRYWIIATFVALIWLAAYSYRPLYSAADQATATPEIATVPPLPTPTFTRLPFPIVTSTALPAPANGAQPPTAVATPEPASSSGGNSTSGNPAPASNAGPAPNAGTAPNAGSAISSTLNQSPSPAPALTADRTLTGTVTVKLLNLRAAPSANAAILDTLVADTVVTIIQRDAGGNWLKICCGSRTRQVGWVSAALIQIHQPVVAGVLPPATVSAPTPTTPGAFNLALAIQPLSPFVWQGQTFTVQLTLSNRGTLPLTHLSLRDDLPPELRLVAVSASGGGQVQQAGPGEDGPILTVQWPALAAGAQVTATVVVQVAPTTPNGQFIKNLAVVNTPEVGDVISGFSVAMPPVTLPKF